MLIKTNKKFFSLLSTKAFAGDYQVFATDFSILHLSIYTYYEQLCFIINFILVFTKYARWHRIILLLVTNVT